MKSFVVAGSSKLFFYCLWSKLSDVLMLCTAIWDVHVSNLGQHTYYVVWFFEVSPSGCQDSADTAQLNQFRVTKFQTYEMLKSEKKNARLNFTAGMIA
jgi:hypothetical protein